MTTLADFDRRAKVLADARNALAGIVGDLNAGIDALKRDHMKALKSAVNAAAEQHDKLKALIEEHPELFVKPRTVVLHGIKLGYRKGTGEVEFDDPQAVVDRIRKHFPDQFDALVKVDEKPRKAALAQLLTGAELKRLGATVGVTGDEVFIKATDSAVDKLVEQLLASATAEAA